MIRIHDEIHRHCGRSAVGVGKSLIVRIVLAKDPCCPRIGTTVVQHADRVKVIKRQPDFDRGARRQLVGKALVVATIGASVKIDRVRCSGGGPAVRAGNGRSRYSIGSHQLDGHILNCKRIGPKTFDQS